MSLSGATPAFAEHWNKQRVGEFGAERPEGVTMEIRAGLAWEERRFWRREPTLRASEEVKWGTRRDSSTERISASWNVSVMFASHLIR